MLILAFQFILTSQLTDDFVDEMLCSHAIRVMGSQHPSRQIPAETDAKILAVLKEGYEAIKRRGFLPKGLVEEDLIQRLHQEDPFFSDFWNQFQRGYVRMPPHFKREILLQYLKFRIEGGEFLENALESAMGMAQVVSLRPQEYHFSSAWGLNEYFEWQKNHPIPEDVVDHHIILDSSVYADVGSVDSKIAWYTDLRTSLAKGLGLDDIGRIGMTPTVVMEQGSGAMPSVRAHMGAWALDKAFERPLSAEDLNFIDRTAHFFGSIGVGKAPNSASNGEVINDDWIVAEALYAEGTFFTMDRNLARPFEEFVGIDPEVHGVTKPSRSRTEVFQEFGIELKVEINEWRSFNNRFKSMNIPVIEVTVKDLKTGSVRTMRLIRLRIAQQSPLPVP